MERLQAILSNLAHPHPIPLTTTLQDRLNHLVSHFQTPDHPPYSAMIERALGELKDKRGSSEESISQFLEKTYSSLPLAHSAFLKHHLAKLCESGDIVATSGKRYMLPTKTPTLHLSTNFERRPKRRKCRWNWEKRLKKKRNLRRSKHVDVFENNREADEEVEHEVCSKHNQVELGQTKRLLSCDVKDYSYGDPNVFPTERRSYHFEICPSETIGGDGRVVHAQEIEEMSPERPPGFEFIRVGNLTIVDSKATVAQPCLETDGMEVSQSAMASIKMKGDKIYCRRRKRKCEQSEADTRDACIKPEQPNLELPSKVSSPNSNQLLEKQESHDVIQQKLPQPLRRSSRTRIPKHDIAKGGNDVDTSDEESLTRFCRSQPRQPKRKFSHHFTDESQQKRKLKRNSVLGDEDDNGESKLKQLRKPNSSIYGSNSKGMLLVETGTDADSRVVRKGKIKCGEGDEDYLPPPVILALGQHKGKGRRRGPVNAASKNKHLGQ